MTGAAADGRDVSFRWYAHAQLRNAETVHEIDRLERERYRLALTRSHFGRREDEAAGLDLDRAPRCFLRVQFHHPGRGHAEAGGAAAEAQQRVPARAGQERTTGNSRST